jgi:signal transduction histidine kinase
VVRLLSRIGLRARLALVMFLTMACTIAILVVTYLRQEQRVKAYVSAISSDLATVSAVTRIPSTGDPKQILEAYKDELTKLGLKGLRVEATNPGGDIVASYDPRRVGKKSALRKRSSKAKEDPFHISATLPDVDLDPAGGQTSFSIQVPVVQSGKVVGYVVFHGAADEVTSLLRSTYLLRSIWIIATMLLGLGTMVYLVFLFTQPVDMVVNAANQVAQGNLYVKLPEDGSEEMARLARTFNQMVERLRENRKLQEKLNEMDKLSVLGRFAGTVAHEVRNSLNFINLSIDQLRAKRLNADERTLAEVRRNLANVKEEIGRLNQMVNEFLVLGRPSPPRRMPCDVAAVLKEALALVEKQAQSQDIRVLNDFAEAWPPLWADASQLKTCFVNILTNAVQAMPQGGEIRISGNVIPRDGQPERLCLRFADTGPGIPPEDREKIFAPYFSTKATGFGLGLAITRKIIEDHGGRIYAEGRESDRGQGTVIVVELPTAPAQDVAAVGASAASSAA